MRVCVCVTQVGTDQPIKLMSLDIDWSAPEWVSPTDPTQPTHIALSDLLRWPTNNAAHTAPAGGFNGGGGVGGGGGGGEGSKRGGETAGGIEGGRTGEESGGCLM